MKAENGWTVEEMPDQTGRVAIVSGANSGLGLETARALAERNAHVVLACRSMDKGRAAAADIRRQSPAAELTPMWLDLADLSSVRAFAEVYMERFRRLDILVNNAGVMGLPRMETADGFEMQFGVNHLGHFALTGLLLPVLLQTPGARVVTVSSGMHRAGAIDFQDLNWESSYDRWGAYGRSKLANLLFTYELERRFRAADVDIVSLAAHPGYAATNLQTAAPELEGSLVRKMVMTVANKLFAQSAEMGALPQLFAATAPAVAGGAYYGPGGLQEMRGYPARADSSSRSKDREVAARLWQVSTELTGVTYAQLEEKVHVPSTD